MASGDCPENQVLIAQGPGASPRAEARPSGLTLAVNPALPSGNPFSAKTGSGKVLGKDVCFL